MKILRIFFLFLLSTLVISCGESQVRYGELGSAGVISSPLCEKAKARITDLQRISFELPPYFKSVPCQNWPDYTHSARSDYVSVEIPGVISNDKIKSISGVHTLRISAGYELTGYYLSPEVFFEDYKEYLAKRMKTYQLVTASWGQWAGGKCARFYSDNDSGLYVLRVVDYFCWESVSGSSFPIQIHATQKYTSDQMITDLDKDFVKPVLDSIQIYALTSGKLKKWEGDRNKFCTSLISSYENKTSSSLSDDLDQRRAVRYLRSCGFEAPNPVGIESWKELFRKDGQLIGRPVANNELFREVTQEQFKELENQLMSLRPKLGVRPEASIQGLSQDGKRSVTKLRLTGPYDGAWYMFPPDYSDRSGIGIRNDAVKGRMLDVLLWEGGIPLGLKIVSSGT